MHTRSTPLLKVPPFPGARIGVLAVPAACPSTTLDEVEVDALIERMRALNIGDGLDGPLDSRRAEFNNRVLTYDYRDPFSGKPLKVEQAIELCGFWQRLIDRNRDLAAAVGFAFWKRDTVAPLLWGGRDLPFVVRADEIERGSTVAIWRSRTSDRLLQGLQGKDVTLVEVEDGFIRSAGLGADCVPPLSIVVDRLGAHFDPSRPSELEKLIQAGSTSDPQLERARALRLSITDSGLSKYAVSTQIMPRRAGARTHILVPGQVEDDRSVVEGGGSLRTNLELLRRVRERAPDAYILYKPHPDVEAGHRIGGMPDSEALSHADEVVRDEPITALMAMVDEVHVNTSLAGFEALMRGKSVTTYGVPFYAGWSLTDDQGEVPARRTARRTIDELVAAVLLEYPRYLDPVTGLPCPPEVVVDRLIQGRTPASNLIVGLRRVQGRIMRRIRSIVA